MHRLESAPHPSRRRSWLATASCLVLVLGLAAVAACSDEVNGAVIRELAVGSWACAPDAEGAREQPFTVGIEDDGTFVVSAEPGSTPHGEARPGGEFSGTWAIEDGNLEWGFDDVQSTEKALVEDFEALTLESTGFVLRHPGPFEANDGVDDPAGEQDILVDAHGPDSVTLSVPGGDPWTCNRQ